MRAIPKSLPADRIRQNVLDLLETFPAGLTSAEMAEKRGGDAQRYLQACVVLQGQGRIYKDQSRQVAVWRRVI